MFVGHSARVIEENNVVDISFFQMHTIMISCYGVDLRVPLPKGLFGLIETFRYRDVFRESEHERDNTKS